MMLLLAGLVAVGCLLALLNWRWGIMAAVAIGLLQDPIRKLIPGASGILVMVSSPVWLAVVLSALFRRPGMLRGFFNRFPLLGVWVQIFGGYLLIPAILSATYGAGSWMITLLGLFVYSMALLATVCGWSYPHTRFTIERFFCFYVLLAGLMLIGGPLESLGFGSRFPAIGTEALNHVWVTYRTGSAVFMRSGFFAVRT